MLQFRGRRAQKKVRQKAVAVCGHGDQIAMAAFDPADNFVCRVSERQFRFDIKSFVFQL